MAGRRRTGAFAETLSALVLSDRESRLKREDEEREFQRKWQLAGIEAGLEAGRIEPRFRGGTFTGFGPRQVSPIESQLFGTGAPQGRVSSGVTSPALTRDADLDAMVESGQLEYEQKFKLPGGKTITVKSPKSVKPLTGTAEQALLGFEEPAVPFSGAVPVSESALKTIQLGIGRGRFESPVAAQVGIRQFLPNAQGTYVRPAPEVSPEQFAMPRVANTALMSLLGPIGGISSSLRGLRATPLVSPRTSAVSPQRPSASVGRTLSIGSVSELVSDAQAAQAEGFSREEVEAQLRQFGVPDDHIQQILDAAGL